MDWFVPALSLVTAVVVLITAIVTYITRKEIKEIHVLVNSRMTTALGHIEKLTKASVAAGIRIDQLTEALVVSDTDVPAEPGERDHGTPPVIP